MPSARAAHTNVRTTEAVLALSCFVAGSSTGSFFFAASSSRRSAIAASRHGEQDRRRRSGPRRGARRHSSHQPSSSAVVGRIGPSGRNCSMTSSCETSAAPSSSRHVADEPRAIGPLRARVELVEPPIRLRAQRRDRRHRLELASPRPCDRPSLRRARRAPRATRRRRAAARRRRASASIAPGPSSSRSRRSTPSLRHTSHARSRSPRPAKRSMSRS